MELFILFLLIYLGIGVWFAGYIPQQINKQIQQITILITAIDTQLKFWKELEISKTDYTKKQNEKYELINKLAFYKKLQRNTHQDTFTWKAVTLWVLLIPQSMAGMTKK